MTITKNKVGVAMNTKNAFHEIALRDKFRIGAFSKLKEKIDHI